MNTRAMNNKQQKIGTGTTFRTISILALLAIVLFSSFAEAQVIQPLRSPRQWSPQAKGAVIGGAAGAAAGAIIHKRNRVVGGVVGGAVGAGAGYAIGKRIDNKRKAAAALAARRAEEERIAAARRADNESYGQANRVLLARGKKAPALAAAAGVGAGAAVAGAAYAANGTTPATLAPAQPTYMTNTGYLLNPTFGDPTSAYPDSEVRRKSW